MTDPERLDGQTTAEWMLSPLLERDVDDLQAWMDGEFGYSSSAPWPTIAKVLHAARQSVTLTTQLEVARKALERIAKIEYAEPGTFRYIARDAIATLSSPKGGA